MSERNSGQWQPIETAPKDGSVIIALVYGQVVAVKYTGIIDWFDGSTCGPSRYAWIKEGAKDADDELLPTHWMPLPDPPKEAINNAH